MSVSKLLLTKTGFSAGLQFNCIVAGAFPIAESPEHGVTLMRKYIARCSHGIILLFTLRRVLLACSSCRRKRGLAFRVSAALVHGRKTCDPFRSHKTKIVGARTDAAGRSHQQERECALVRRTSVCFLPGLSRSVTAARSEAIPLSAVPFTTARLFLWGTDISGAFGANTQGLRMV